MIKKAICNILLDAKKKQILKKGSYFSFAAFNLNLSSSFRRKNRWESFFPPRFPNKLIFQHCKHLQHLDNYWFGANRLRRNLLIFPWIGSGKKTADINPPLIHMLAERSAFTQELGCVSGPHTSRLWPRMPATQTCLNPNAKGSKRHHASQEWRRLKWKLEHSEVPKIAHRSYQKFFNWWYILSLISKWCIICVNIWQSED